MEHILKTDILTQLSQYVYAEMRTEDLLVALDILRRQKSIYDRGTEATVLAVPLEARTEFREQLNSGTWISGINSAIFWVKRELATRPHVPNKQERRKIRQEKAKRSRGQSKSRNK